MKKVEIKKITPPTVDFYSPDGEFLGSLNEYEFLDARVQIMTKKITGYYVIFNGEQIEIDDDGRLEQPNEMFSEIEDLLRKLLGF